MQVRFHHLNTPTAHTQVSGILAVKDFNERNAKYTPRIGEINGSCDKILTIISVGNATSSAAAANAIVTAIKAETPNPSVVVGSHFAIQITDERMLGPA